MPAPVRLCIYSDTVHGDALVDDERVRGVLGSDYPFLVYIGEVARHFESTTVLGRYEARTGPEFVPMPERVELLPLPSYESLASLPAVARSLVGTARGFWRGAGAADVVWCFGPHPLSLLLAVIARLRRRRIVIGVRIDPIAYFAARRSNAPGWQSPAVRLLAWAFRRTAGAGRVTAVGAALAQQYPAAVVHDMRISLTPEADIAEPRRRDGSEPLVRLLTVGRIAPEKNPHLLLDAMRRLVEGSIPVHLTWIGTGELRDEVIARTRELGLADAIDFPGHVPFGPRLLAAYRSADVFVHVALTEGVPQVIYEAFAAGLAVVATDVGGVRDACDDGSAALLVPPSDLAALVAAIQELATDPEPAMRLARRGVELARTESLEQSAARAARFVAG